SSRRRHTRFSRDWSSDVCSSDLLSGILLVFNRPRKQAGETGELLDGEGFGAPPRIDPRRLQGARDRLGVGQPSGAQGVSQRLARSEERRVGKEGSARASPWHEQK